MPTIDEMYSDLEQADAAGDYELANVIASRIKSATPRIDTTKSPDPYKVAWEGDRDMEALTRPQSGPVAQTGADVARLAAAVQQGVRQGRIQVGRGMYEAGVGAGQLLTDAWNKISGMDTGRGLDVMAEQSEEAGKFLSGQPAGIVGPIAGGMAATAPLGAIRAPAAVGRAVQAAAKVAPTMTRVGQGAVLGAGYGAMAPVTDEQSRGSNVATGAVAGAAGASAAEVLGRAITPVQQAVDASRQKMVRLAEALGVRLTPGQRSGSVPLQQLEASLASNPLTAGPIARLREENQKAINRAAASSFGEDADAITEDVIDAAAQRIGGVFEQSTKGLKVTLDDQFRNDLSDVLSEYRSSLPSLRNPKIEALIEDVNKTLLPAGGGNAKLKGEIYQKIVSDLSRIARSAGKGENADREYARALLSVKEVMDDAAARVMPAEQQQAFREARSQYRNLMTVVNSGAVKAENVAGRTLKTSMSRRDRMGMARGRDQSQLARAARVGDYFQPVVGDSGTATRMSVPLMLTGGGAASGAGAVAFGPAGAVLAPAVAAGGANLATRAYLSPAMQQYMQNTILDEVSRKALTQSGGILGLIANQ